MLKYGFKMLKYGFKMLNFFFSNFGGFKGITLQTKLEEAREKMQDVDKEVFQLVCGKKIVVLKPQRSFS